MIDLHCLVGLSHVQKRIEPTGQRITRIQRTVHHMLLIQIGIPKHDASWRILIAQLFPRSRHVFWPNKHGPPIAIVAKAKANDEFLWVHLYDLIFQPAEGIVFKIDHPSRCYVGDPID